MNVDISIVIPTYKRKEGLKSCLKSLFEQEFPSGRYEIIVVDDGADGAVEKMVKDLKADFAQLRYFRQEHLGPAVARNLGVRNSQGSIVGFIDDDCTVYKDWVKLMFEAHQKNPEIAAVGGLTVTASGRTPVLVSQFLSTCSIETYLNGKWEVIFFPTCNVSLKKQIFDKFSFDEKFPLPGGEDLEFFWRLFKGGYRFIWDKNIKTIHYRLDTSISFFKQAYIYGRGNLLVQHLHQDQPLLKELKTGKITFWAATLINALKIPRFSYILGSRLIREEAIKDTHKKISVYAYFSLHKLFYLSGNIFEFMRILGKKINIRQACHSPRLLILDITHSCNLHCKICDIWKTAGKEKDIDISYVQKVLFQAKKLKIREIALSGGEALLRKDIFEIFAYARSLKIKDLGVLTNGILVKEYWEKLKPYLIDNTVSLVVSLDSLRRDLHNQVRNSDSAWQKTKEALEAVSALKKIYPRINFNVISIILDQNLEELRDLAVFVRSLGANSLQFQGLLSNNLRMAERRQSPYWVTDERLPLLDAAVDKLIEFKNGNSGFIKNSVLNLTLIKKYYRGKLSNSDIGCLSAYETVLVSNQGAYTTCFSPYGGVRAQDLEDVLRSQEIIRARREVKNCSWPCLLPCFCDYE